MYCNRCGKQLGEESSFCNACGTQVGANISSGFQDNQSNTTNANAFGNDYMENPRDRGGFWWGLLGFVTGGLIAIILWAIFRREYPKRAKAILTGCIISVVLAFVFFFFFADKLMDWAESQNGTGAVITYLLNWIKS